MLQNGLQKHKQTSAHNTNFKNRKKLNSIFNNLKKKQYLYKNQNSDRSTHRSNRKRYNAGISRVISQCNVS